MEFVKSELKGHPRDKVVPGKFGKLQKLILPEYGPTVILIAREESTQGHFGHASLRTEVFGSSPPKSCVYVYTI